MRAVLVLWPTLAIACSPLDAGQMNVDKTI